MHFYLSLGLFSGLTCLVYSVSCPILAFLFSALTILAFETTTSETTTLQFGLKPVVLGLVVVRRYYIVLKLNQELKPILTEIIIIIIGVEAEVQWLCNTSWNPMYWVWSWGSEPSPPLGVWVYRTNNNNKLRPTKIFKTKLI